MPGKLSKDLGIQPGLDLDGWYQDRCIEFADQYGFPRGWICYWWSQITLVRMAHARQSQDIAEDAAMHDVFGAFRNVKMGEGSCN